MSIHTLHARIFEAQRETAKANADGQTWLTRAIELSGEKAELTSQRGFDRKRAALSSIVDADLHAQQQEFESAQQYNKQSDSLYATNGLFNFVGETETKTEQEHYTPKVF